MIHIESLAKVYDQGEHPVTVFDKLSLQLKDGEFLALMGTSGAGKTTLLQLLGCLDTPSGGSYWLAGREVSKLGEDELAALRNQHIGFIFQTSFFIDYLDLLDNVALPGFYARTTLQHGEARQRAAELLDTVGLSHRHSHRPTMLSGGERQRAAIARALFNKPSLLLADEPTGNLDADNTLRVMDILTGLNTSGISILMVTHDPLVAARAQRQAQLCNGELRTLTDGAI